MTKLLSFFSIGWVKYVAIGIAVGVYTAMVYNFGHTNGTNQEKLNTMALQNKYNEEAVDLTRLQFDLLNENIKALQAASENFQNSQSKTNTVIKHLNTETIKEIEKPMYKECVVSEEYFKEITESIHKLNGK